MRKHCVWNHVTFSVLAMSLVPTVASGQLAAVISPPVEHPIALPTESLTPYAWRINSGAWGESLVDEGYRLRGFNEVLEIKSPGGQGIDRVALKYDADGNLLDVRIAEVKTHRGGTARLNETKRGRQLSKTLLREQFRDMRSSSDPRLREVALDISRFRRRNSVPLEKLGEFHDINTQTGRYVLRDPISGAERANRTVERYLKDIQQNAQSRASRGFATRSLSQWDQIRQTSMTQALDKQGVARLRIFDRGSKNLLSRVARKSAARSLHGLTRAAGPIGAAVALVMDGQEIYSQIDAYRQGKINRRELTIALSQIGGGMAGAAAGATAGLATGAWMGAFGGPFAWVTVPVGATVGAGIGGFGGYFAGSAAGGAIAQGWYAGIDEYVKREIDDWIVNSSYLQLTAPR